MLRFWALQQRPLSLNFERMSSISLLLDNSEGFVHGRRDSIHSFLFLKFEIRKFKLLPPLTGIRWMIDKSFSSLFRVMPRRLMISKGSDVSDFLTLRFPSMLSSQKRISHLDTKKDRALASIHPDFKKGAVGEPEETSFFCLKSNIKLGVLRIGNDERDFCFLVGAQRSYSCCFRTSSLDSQAAAMICTALPW